VDRVLSYIGLAMKAGKVVTGESGVATNLKEGHVLLCIVAQDASANTKKKFRNMCAYRTLPLVEYGTKETLGRAIGKEFRATIGITDENFVKMIQSKLPK